MTFKGKRVLVTGGAGFVGSNLVDLLVEREASVIVLDDLFTGNLNNIQNYDSVEFVKGSVTDRQLTNKLVKEADYVFHLAVRNIIVSTQQPEMDFEANARGTFNILLAAKEYGIQRVIYTSSASIYGNPRYLPINEDDNISILNPYAASKFTGESYCFAYYEMFDVPISVVRYSNVYGIRQNPGNPYCGVISKFFDSALKGEPILIHGDGEQTRDFTYVGDAVDATMLAALSPKAEGQVFNVGSGKETTINDLAQMINHLCGARSKIIHIDRRDIDNIRRRVMNIEKIRHFLRWVPTINQSEGLQKTYEWLQKDSERRRFVA
ncbi:NAD-dependent epimerase/dehydratase family protein [candidate division KSB1 bacterium]|nr:NAD-dependent epimerase/dehydratase family protein [candidate division KSB1 bacterium]